VLLPKLLPFAQGLRCLYPGIVVQEDKAPSHTAKIHQTYYNAAEVQRLIWPGNSLDLNMIEPAWGYLKRVTTQKGPLQSRAAAEKAWAKAWDELEQWRIQAWIERIPRHIQKVIELKGGNDYREGAEENQRSRKELRQAAQKKQGSIQKVHNSYQEVLLPLCGLPEGYHALFMLNQGTQVELIEEISDEEWQRTVDLVVPNSRRDAQAVELIDERRQHKERRRQRQSLPPEAAQTLQIAEVVGRQLRPRKPRKPVEFNVRWAPINQSIAKK
jgi:hypothetical protein